MHKPQESENSTQSNQGFGLKLSRILGNPWIDRLIAVLAVVPFALVLGAKLNGDELDLPRIALLIQMVLQIASMVVRRPPQRVSPNPWYWLLAFVATYWLFLSAGFSGPGIPLAPPVVTNILGILTLISVVYARFSLGRNIGFVPAQRELAVHGAYRYVRHPIYTSIFFGYLTLILSAYSLNNLLILGLGVFWFVVKSFVEENFLKLDPEYLDYMKRVRWRWFPYIA